DPEAKRKLDQLCKDRGMTQIAVLSRLVGWFTRQNDLIQTAVLGQLKGRDLQDLAELLVKRMAKGDESAGPR
ncbi:MAG TPA: hypothetical protein VK324_13385, partial [Tepidisphaeraceae bacterium]|nr:hypothetical protein [Tepidisphaeraceae bacterium]